MSVHRFALAALLVSMVLAAPVRAEDERREMDLLSEKDLSYFKVEGAAGWAIDDVSDDLHTLIVCRKPKGKASLAFDRRAFKHPFQARFQIQGGSKNCKGVSLWVVPAEGDWIQVPFSARSVRKVAWHKLRLTVENGKASVKAAGTAGDEVDVPTDQELRFAIKVKKGGSIVLRKPQIRYLVIQEAQAKPEKDFVRIFDGKTLEGWTTVPASTFVVTKERIEFQEVPFDKKPQSELVYTDGRFKNFVLRCKVASGAQGVMMLGRFGTEGQRATLIGLDGYIPGDRDWSDVEFEVSGKNIALTVNGSRVVNQQGTNDQPVPILFLVVQGGKLGVRDIRIKGENKAPGQSWVRYVKESGGDAEAAAAAVGARGDNPGGGAAAGGGAVGGGSKPMFDGKTLDDWAPRPASMWSVAQGRILGMSEGSAGVLQYSKYVFTGYRITFKVEKGTNKAVYIAKATQKGQTEVPIQQAWLGDRDWTDFEAVVGKGKVTIKAAGKVVHTGQVSDEKGFVAWAVGPEGALGLKDVRFHR